MMIKENKLLSYQKKELHYRKKQSHYKKKCSPTTKKVKYNRFGQNKQIYTQKILQKRAKMRKISKSFSILNKKKSKKKSSRG